MRATHTNLFFAFLFLFWMIYHPSFAQSVSMTKSGIPTPQGTTIATLNLDVSQLDVNEIGELKDAFITFHEKVVSVYLDEPMERMKVVYNRFMLVEDIQLLLNKYGAKIARETYPVSDKSSPTKN